MKSKHLALFLAPLALAWGASATALPTAIDSSINLRAQSGINNVPGSVFDTAFVSQGATVNTLNAAVSANATDPLYPGQFVNSHVAVTATWANAASGNVTFDNVGFTTNAFSGGATPSLGTDWRYTFTADATGQFTMNWNIFDAGSTSTFGLVGFWFTWSETPLQQLNFATSGTLTRDIVAGHTYFANLENQASIGGGVDTRTASMNGVFDWSMDTGSVAAIPEPETYAMLLAGLGLLGFAARRWKIKEAAAG